MQMRPKWLQHVMINVVEKKTPMRGSSIGRGASISVNKVIWVPQFSIFHQTYSPEAPFLTKSSMKRDKQPVEKTYLEITCIDKNTVQIVRIHKSIFYSRDKS